MLDSVDIQIGGISFLLPLCFLVISILVSRFLRLSLWIVLVAGSLPLATLYMDLPIAGFSEGYGSLKAALILWGILLCAALGFKAGSRVLEAGFGGIRIIAAVFMWGSAIAAGILYFDQDFLDLYLPGWKSSLGVVFVLAAMLAFSLSLMRMTKTALAAAFWFFVCLTVGTEVFFDRLPGSIFDFPVSELSRFIPENLAPVSNGGAKSATFSKRLSDTGGGLKIAVVGGASVTGFPYKRSYAFPARLEEMFAERYPDLNCRVENYGGDNFGIYQISETVEKQILNKRPDVLIVSGWSADAVKNSNAFGMPGLSEAEALAEVSKRKFVASVLPFLESIFESRLFRTLKITAKRFSGQRKDTSRKRGKVRVSPQEYKRVLNGIVTKAEKAGIVPILLFEEAGEGTPAKRKKDYYEATAWVAAEHGIGVLSLSEDLDSNGSVLKGNLMSRQGHELVAKALFRKLTAMPGIMKKGRVMASLRRDSGLVVRSPYIVPLRSSDVNGDLIFKIRVPAAGNRYYRVLFSVNGKFEADKRLRGSDFVNVRFSVPQKYKKLPALEIAVQTLPSPQPEADRIGHSGIFTPVAIEAVSSFSGRSLLRAGSYQHQPQEGAVLSILAVNYKNGLMLRKADFSQEELVNAAKWLRSLPWGAITLISLNRSVPGDLPATLTGALSYIGCRVFPTPGMPFAAVGAVGSKAGSALVKGRGGLDNTKEAAVKVGSKLLSEISLFEIATASVGGREMNPGAGE